MDILDGRNNQARQFVIARSEKYKTSEPAGYMFVVPKNSVVLKFAVVVLKADSNSNASIQFNMQAGNTSYNVMELDLNAEGINQKDASHLACYQPTGGKVYVTLNNVNGDGEFFVLLEIATDNTTGAYLGE